MKKFVLAVVAIVLVLALAFGGLLLISYNNTREDTVPAVTAELFGQALAPQSASWQQPVLGGLLYKPFTPAVQEQPQDLGSFEVGVSPAFGTPEGYDTNLVLNREDGANVFTGPLSRWTDDLIALPGVYRYELSCTMPHRAGQGYGGFTFVGSFTVLEPPPPEEEKPDPAFEAGRTELEQGDIFVMQVLHLPEGVVPTAETELGMAVFTPAGEGNWRALVPVGNTRETGEYGVTVTAGELSWEATVTVLKFAFDVQDLIIDTEDPDISEANSQKAINEYNEVMLAMRKTADEESYWTGMFIQPVEGRISTNFGEIRTTNGDPASARPHYGMDIAAAEGTPIMATNSGRVVFADYLLAVGWTIIIEHGGGLKSYHFHMVEIGVAEGEMVTKGDIIGQVGTTGYSTGPHLHLEMRIGDAAISPQMLFEDSAGLYSLDWQVEDEAEDAPAA